MQPVSHRENWFQQLMQIVKSFTLREVLLRRVDPATELPYPPLKQSKESPFLMLGDHPVIGIVLLRGPTSYPAWAPESSADQG